MINNNLFTVACTLILLGILLSGCTGNDGNDNEINNVEILNVTQSPESPEPGDEIIITVTVKNCSGCDLDYHAYFADESPGSQTMTNQGNGKFEAIIGPFDNGTEVWYMVSANDNRGNFIVWEADTIQIGDVERNSKTSLDISNINRSPRNITKETSDVTITADITSNVMLTDKWFMYKIISKQGNQGGLGRMLYKTGDTFEQTINIDTYDKGTMIFFRIAAKDQSGNTALSPTFSFEIYI